LLEALPSDSWTSTDWWKLWVFGHTHPSCGPSASCLSSHTTNQCHEIYLVPLCCPFVLFLVILLFKKTPSIVLTCCLVYLRLWRSLRYWEKPCVR
jgi:hypothetical protein